MAYCIVRRQPRVALRRRRRLRRARGRSPRNRSGSAWQRAIGRGARRRRLRSGRPAHPSRPTDAPGAMAWLRLRARPLRGASRRRTGRALYRASPRAAIACPTSCGRSAGRAVASPSSTGAGDAALRCRRRAPSPVALRRQRVVSTSAASTLVVTRRRALDDAPISAAIAARIAFLDAVVPALVARADRDRRGASAAARCRRCRGRRPPRPVRVYAVAEDGDAGVGAVAGRARDDGMPSSANWRCSRRGRTCRRSRPRSSSSGSIRARQPPTRWRLLRVLSRSRRPRPGLDGDACRSRSARGASAAFSRSISPSTSTGAAFAASVEPPVAGAAVTVPSAVAASWPASTRRCRRRAARRCGARSATLARARSPTAAADSPAPLRHGVVDGPGAVAAFQVSDARWLLMLFPQRAPAFPVTAVALLAGLLALLLAGFEINRRRADGERRNAERALAEKQNLLNTMQVPLVVVDPNTDVIVSSNRAAEAIGIRAGGRFADLVWPDDARARALRADAGRARPSRGAPTACRSPCATSTGAARRATPSSDRSPSPRRSRRSPPTSGIGSACCSCSSPTPTWRCSPTTSTSRAHRDERRRLAGLLSHGVDTLARVLEHCLSQPDSDADQRANSPRGSPTTSSAASPSPPGCSITGTRSRRSRPTASSIAISSSRRSIASAAFCARSATIASCARGCTGTTACSPSPRPDGRILEVDVDWPEPLRVHLAGARRLRLVPRRGDRQRRAARRAGHAARRVGVLRSRASRARVRRHRILPPPGTDRSAGGDAYGGLAMLRTIARLCEWREFQLESGTGTFQVTWRVPLSERGVQGAD